MMCYSYYSEEGVDLLMRIGIKRVVVFGEFEMIRGDASHKAYDSVVERAVQLIKESDVSFVEEVEARISSVESAARSFVYRVVKNAVSSASGRTDIIVSVWVSEYLTGLWGNAKVSTPEHDIGVFAFVLDVNVCSFD